VIPEPDQYLSFLMGARAVSDEELRALGIEIAERYGKGRRGLLVPATSISAYAELLREKLEPTYWNEIVGRTEIVFWFKLADGTLKELAYSPESRDEIARLCSELNRDPIEKTSDVPRYLAGNRFYRELMAAFHGVSAP
jgi:hypothetical protein